MANIPMSRPPRSYRAYGLAVRSPIALPFTPFPSPPAGVPDVTVRIGPIPQTSRRLPKDPASPVRGKPPPAAS